MGIISRQLLKVIEYVNDRHDTIIYKFPMNDRAEIMNGSSLTVREGQVAIFMKDGRIADVFAPGRYKLTTANLPVLTSIMSWAKGFNSPFKCDVYYVETTQFKGQKWGTPNPITMRDKEFGMVQIRGFGKFSFRVTDAKLFMQTMSGSKREFKTTDIDEHLRGIIVSTITDVLADSKYSAIDLASKLTQFNEIAKASLEKHFTNIGLALMIFVIENINFPEEIDKAIKQSVSLGILGGQMHNYTAKAKADALQSAAQNPGMAGTMFGMGVMGGLGQQAFGGPGMGMGMGVAAQNQQSAGAKRFCPECGGSILKENAKFCPDCGKKLGDGCPKCGATVKPDAKFCPECGTKL